MKVGVPSEIKAQESRVSKGILGLECKIKFKNTGVTKGILELCIYF